MEGIVFLAIAFIFFLVFCIVSGLIALYKSRRTEKAVNSLQQKVLSLQSQVTVLKDAIKKKDEVPSTADRQSVSHDEFPATEEKTGEQPEKVIIVQQETPEPVQTAAKTESTIKGERPGNKVRSMLQKLEKLTLENWTGIIGVLITIIGIGFLGVFTALKLSEIYRFCMIVIVSLILLIIYFIFRSSQKWYKLMLWIRSMAAALFLLACAGAGGIPGIRWINNPFISLGVLCLGIGVNILLSIVGKKQVVASVHLLLSLASLTVAPQGMVIFVVATLVTLSGIILTFREKWDMHLLFTTFLYFAYALFYYFTAGAPDLAMQITGVCSLFCVNVLALFVHYRKVYEHPRFEIKPFLTHLLTWVYLGGGLFLYFPRVFWISIPLGAGAILCFTLAHRARALKIRWLFYTDILMAQVVAVIAVISLREWDVLYYPLTGLLVIESLVFLFIVLTENEPFLYHCGQWFFYLFSLIFAIMSTVIREGQEVDTLFPHSVLILICAIPALVYHIAVHYRLAKMAAGESISTAGLQWFRRYNIACGVIACVFLLLLYRQWQVELPRVVFPDAGYLLLIPLGVIIYIRQKIQSAGLGAGLLFILVCMHISVWRDPLLTGETFWYEKIIFALPLFLLDIASIIFTCIKPINKHLKWPGIYLLTLHLCIVSYFILDPLSSLLPGIAWLLFSVVLREAGRFAGRRYGDRCNAMGSPDTHLLHAGYACIGAFLFLGYFPVHLHSTQYIWIFKARLLTGILALLVLLYWTVLKKPEGRKVSRSFEILHPVLPELTAVFAAIIVIAEVQADYLPVAWILFGLLMLFTGTLFRQRFSRCRFHSLLLYWLSTINTTFLMWPLITPSLNYPDSTWFSVLIAACLQFCYIVIFYKLGRLDSVEFPGVLNWLKPFANTVARKKNLWIFYPFFIVITLFVIRSSDASLLTLLLTAECFFVFLVSIIVKESHFRYLSMAGIAGCMIRLVIYDLASSNILTKAIVCVGVGLLLIGMNMIYNKFSGRYRQK